MTATATRSPGTGRQLSNLAVVLTLGKFEGRQMVRHPLFWLAAVAAAALSVFELIQEAPVLNRVSMALAWTVAPLAVAVAFLAGWAVLRAKGRTDSDPPAAMPASMSLRVSGVVAGLAWPAAATFLLQLVVLGWLLFRDPVTSVVWSELLVGPAYVALAGATSAAATRGFPHASIPLVVLLLLGLVQIAVPYRSEDWGSVIGPSALAPIDWPQTIIPYEVAFRPSALHLGYLVGLIFVFAGLATLGRATRSGWLVLGAGVLLAGVLGPAQLGPITEGQRAEAMSRLVGDGADLTCETHDAVTYCAMPGYGAWIDNWAQVVAPMLDSVPTEAGADLEVQQYPLHNTFLLDATPQNDWWWIARTYEDYVTRDVAAVGSVLADFTISYELDGAVARQLIGCEHACEEPSQRVVALWLTTQDTRSRLNVEERASEESDSADVSECMVARLWDVPNAHELIRSNWETLTSPETSYEDAGEILGIDVPQGYDEHGRLESGCR